MPTNEPYTLGEISRNVLALRSDISKLAAGLDDRPDWQDVARIEKGIRDNHDHDMANITNTVKNVETQVAEVKDNNKWLNRLVAGAAITGLISLLMSASQLPALG